MNPSPDLLEATRLPALCRGVCLYAGLPLPPAHPSAKRFIVRTGKEPPKLLARLLEEGLLDDGIEIRTFPNADEVDTSIGEQGQIIIRPGYSAPCPDPEAFRRLVAAKDESMLLFCVEEHDETGRPLSLTWAAIPEEEPEGQGSLRAAVKSYVVCCT